MPQQKNLQRNEEIHGVMSRLFAKKGYHATTMREIARELDMKPSSLYNYFESKEEALFNLLNDAMDVALELVKDICREEISAEEKLHRIISFYTHHYSVKREGLVLLIEHVRNLAEERQRIIIDKERRFANMVASILGDLDMEGRMKAIPPKIAVFAFFGMVHYTVKWYHAEGPVGPAELAKYFVEIFTNGILR